MDKSFLQFISSDPDSQSRFIRMNLVKDLDRNGLAVSQATLVANIVVCYSFYCPNEKADAILSEAFREFTANLGARLNKLQEASYRDSLSPSTRVGEKGQPYIADCLSFGHAISALSAGCKLAYSLNACVSSGFKPRQYTSHPPNYKSILSSPGIFGMVLRIECKRQRIQGLNRGGAARSAYSGISVTPTLIYSSPEHAFKTVESVVGPRY